MRGSFRITIYNLHVAIAFFIWRSVALPFSFRFDRVLKHLKSQVSLVATPREDSLYCQADLGWQASSRLSRFENRMRRMHMEQALRKGTCLSCFGCCPSHRRPDSTVWILREWSQAGQSEEWMSYSWWLLYYWSARQDSKDRFADLAL